MRWQRLTVYVVLLIAWSAFAVWQYQGYLYQRALIEESLHQQSHSVMNAVVGGVRSHRRMGYFFEVQIRGLLEELVKSDDVLAVSICSEEGEPLLSAGRMDLLDAASPMDTGDHWDATGFRLVESFDIQPRAPGGGIGGGIGGGHGRHVASDPRDDESAFVGGGSFYGVLLLDRRRCDRLREKNAWSHFFVTLAAGLVLVCLAFAWWASVRLVEAQGRARLLETETRHLRELNQAAAGLAHETRNPLGLIRGWTQRLADVGMDDVQRERHARSVIEECDRVTARINQFLTFARPCDPEFIYVDPYEVVDELGGILQPDLEAKNVSLDCDDKIAVPSIRADRELFRQALFNLIQNAVQFSPSGDAVRIAIRRMPDGTYRLDVADRGPGVAEDAVDSLFTPYFTTRPDGTGLGLAIVGRIASAHGWEAGYEPRVGGGAVFSIGGIHG